MQIRIGVLVLIIAVAIAAILIMLMVVGCDEDVHSVEEVKKVKIEHVIKQFQQYDLTQKSDRIACLKMLQKNSDVMYKEWNYDRAVPINLAISNMIWLVNEFRTEGR